MAPGAGDAGSRLLIENALVVPMDGSGDARCGAIRRASIRVVAGRIDAVGDLVAEPGEAVLDAGGLVAVPGFVQGHVHFCQTLLRGLADDLPLMRWLRERIWPLEAAHDAESMRVSAELTAAELLLGGTTTVQSIESVRHTEQVFAVARDAGLTTIAGNCLIDVDAPELPRGFATGTAAALAITEELREQFDGTDRLHVAVAPRFVLSCTDELARDAAGYATQHRLRVHTHAAEHRGECAEVERRFGRRYLQVLDAQGLLGERTGLAHCVHLDERERELLVTSRSAVLHCPSANLKLGSGVAPIADYRARGVRVALGADGAPCNNRLSALTELRQAALLQALAAGPGVWPAAEALSALTCGGADALGLDDVGRIAAGARADVVLLAIDDAPLAADDANPVGAVVWSAAEHHVRHVVCGGRLVVRDGALTGVDLTELGHRARDARRSLLSRAGLAR